MKYLKDSRWRFTLAVMVVTGVMYALPKATNYNTKACIASMAWILAAGLCVAVASFRKDRQPIQAIYNWYCAMEYVVQMALM